MAIITGRLGAVSDVGAIRSWTVDYDEEAAKAIASNTQGTEIVLPGNTSWGGNYAAYGDTPPHMPGDAIASFIGSQNGTKGASGAAKSEKITLIVDIAAGGIIGYATDFIGDGALTLGTHGGTITDTSDAAPPTVIGTKLKLAIASGSMTYAELANVGIGVVTLVLERPVATHIDSSTGGTRKTTDDIGNLTGSLTFTMNYGPDSWAVAADMPTVGEYYGAQIFVNATDFWQIDFLRCTKVGPIMANREANPPELLNVTIEMAFSGFVTAGDASYLKGQILNPNGDPYWASV